MNIIQRMKKFPSLFSQEERLSGYCVYGSGDRLEQPSPNFGYGRHSICCIRKYSSLMSAFSIGNASFFMVFVYAKKLQDAGLSIKATATSPRAKQQFSY